METARFELAASCVQDRRSSLELRSLRWACHDLHAGMLVTPGRSPPDVFSALELGPSTDRPWPLEPASFLLAYKPVWSCSEGL